MSELVDREAVREFIKSYRHSTDVAFDMEKHLDEIPAAPRLVRCEDELPEKEGDYLVWTMLYGGHAYTDYYTPKYGWDEYKVIAWMPLPEPPKEDA